MHAGFRRLGPSICTTSSGRHAESVCRPFPCAAISMFPRQLPIINEMRALSIRQPYAELILRGIKTVEYRTRPTRIIGERFYIYASKARAASPIWSEDLRVATPPKWMLELAEQVGMIEAGALLPTGVIVGSAVIEKVSQV